jgi:hypothetical protein
MGQGHLGAALAALLGFSGFPACAPVYESRTSVVVSRETIIGAKSAPILREVVPASAKLDGDFVVVRIVERRSCWRQVAEQRVVEDRIERELDTPIFALEVAAAATPLVLLVAGASDAAGNSRRETPEGPGIPPEVAAGAVLVLAGVALTGAIVDGFAARDDTKRRTETGPIGLALVSCGVGPANSTPVELVLPDGSRLRDDRRFRDRADSFLREHAGIAGRGRGWKSRRSFSRR